MIHVHTSHATDETGMVVAYSEGWAYTLPKPVIKATRAYLIIFGGAHPFGAEFHAVDDKVAIEYAAEMWTGPYQIKESITTWRDVINVKAGK